MLTFKDNFSIIKKSQIENAGVAEWQTRMFKGHVRKSVGSSPTARTSKKVIAMFSRYFLILIFTGKDLNGWNSKGNCVCVCPPRRDSRLPSKKNLTTEQVPPLAPMKKLHSLFHFENKFQNFI